MNNLPACSNVAMFKVVDNLPDKYELGKFIPVKPSRPSYISILSLVHGGCLWILFMTFSFLRLPLTQDGLKGTVATPVVAPPAKQLVSPRDLLDLLNLVARLLELMQPCLI